MQRRRRCHCRNCCCYCFAIDIRECISQSVEQEEFSLRVRTQRIRSSILICIQKQSAGNQSRCHRPNEPTNERTNDKQNILPWHSTTKHTTLHTQMPFLSFYKYLCLPFFFHIHRLLHFLRLEKWCS